MRIATASVIISLFLTPLVSAQDAPSKSALKLQIKELKSTISSDSKAAEKVQESITNYNLELTELENSLTIAESAYNEKKKIYDSNAFEEKAKNLKELEGQAKDYGKQISKLEKTISKSESTISSQKEVKRTNETAEAAQSVKITTHKTAMGLTLNEEEKKSKEAELKKLEKEKSSYSKAVSKADSAIKAADKQKDDAESQKSDLSSKRNSANDQIEKLEKEMEGLDPKSLNKELIALEKKKSVLKLDVDKQRSKVSESEMILNQKNGVIDENKAQVAKLEAQLKNL